MGSPTIPGITPRPPQSGWIPNLSGRVDPIVQQAFDYIFRSLYQLREGVGISTAGLTHITTQITPQISQNLSPGGVAPVGGGGGSVNGATGTLGTPQQTNVPTVTALPGPNDPLSKVGTVITFNGLQYVYTSSPGLAPFWKVTSGLGTPINDVFANLSLYPAANYAPGTDFFATDYQVDYRVNVILGVNTWVFATGAYKAPIASIPTLGVDDAGFIFMATDYFHTYNWDGTAWHFAPGDPGSGFLVATIGPAPNGGLWGLCNGSTYNVAQDNGTLSPVVSPVTANTWLRR